MDIVPESGMRVAGMEWERGDPDVNKIPSWERSHIPIKALTFESMIFRTSQGGICDGSLEGMCAFLVVTWQFPIFLVGCWKFRGESVETLSKYE